MKASPKDPALYAKIKKQIYRKYPKHSAYRSGLLVKSYKKSFETKYGSKKSPYKGNTSGGLRRWFDEKWTNQRGETGYRYKSDVYRPNIRISKGTPRTFGELSGKEIKRARAEKYSKGRVKRF